MTMHTYMVTIFYLMAGGFAGMLLLEILSKTFDAYSILRGDWDLAYKPKASPIEARLLLGNTAQKRKTTGYKQPTFPHKPQRFQGSAFHVLGLNEKPMPTLLELKSAYRRMIGIYHPDLYAKCDQKIQAEATRRAKIINTSYHTLREMF